MKLPQALKITFLPLLLALPAEVHATNVEIPNNVTSIGFNEFSGRRDLTDITIPKSVTSIGECAFFYCANLKVITVDPLNPVYSSVDGVLFNKSQTTLILCPGGKAGSYTIPNGVITLDDHAFYASTHITSVIIPNSVTHIGYETFYSCTGLTNVTIGSGVADIGNEAMGNFGWITFHQCPDLTSITVDAQNTNYCSMDGVLFNKSQTTLIKFPEGKAGNYTLPNSSPDRGTCVL